MTIDEENGGSIRLSICIPTYNFGAFIGETLDSIMPQVVEGVEVVVLDGGSTDDTLDVIGVFQRRYPSLRYHRRDQRGGIDRDLARTVALAQGEFCWLFCGDDLMKPDAIGKMLANISSGHDIYVCGFTTCTRDMQRLSAEPILSLESNAEFELSEDQERVAYCDQALSTVAFFSFAGSLIIRKSKWESVPLNEAFIGSCWAHVARMFEVMSKGLRLKYLADSYLWKRMGNDSFMDQGLVHRYAISIDGYHRLAQCFFGEDSKEAHAVRRVIVNEYPPQTLLSARLALRGGGHRDERLELHRLARKAYKDPGLRNHLFYLSYRWTPLTVYRVVRAGYRSFSSSPLVRRYVG